MRRIVFELTDLVERKERLTGIERVMFNLVIRVDKYFSSIVYVKFDDNEDRFIEITKDQLMYHVNKEIFKFNELPNQLPKNRTKVVLRIKKIVPNKIKSLIKSKLFVSGSSSNTVTTKKFFSFNDNDIFLISGAGWCKDKMIIKLEVEKHKSKFEIYHIVYDIIPIKMPYLFPEGFSDYFEEYFKKIAKICDLFIAISDSTAKDLGNFLKINIENKNKQVEVIRLGDEINKNSTLDELTYHTPKKFILSVGTIELRKNYDLIYETYQIAIIMNMKLPPIIIVGGRGRLTNDLLYKIDNDPKLKKLIIIKNDVSDQELNYLYKNCLFTVYPSIYEGWGLPIAESLAYSKFCLASETSSMPEIGGKLLEYFNPYDPKQLLDLMIKYLDLKTRNIAEENIKNNYKITTWDDTTKQLFEIINKVS